MVSLSKNPREFYATLETIGKARKDEVIVSSELKKQLGLKDKQKIVAVAGLERSPYNSDEYWIKHYSVDKDYQNRGLATKLIDAVFTFADKRKVALKRSTPTEMGLKYLTEPINRAIQKSPNVKIY